MTVVNLPSIYPVRPLAIGWDWWLPPNYSEHGRQIDTLFNWVFWVTLLVGVGVMVTMGYFCYRYRRSPDRHWVSLPMAIPAWR